MLVDSAHDKYAFVVAASDNYLDGLVAMFNSLEYHDINADVILVSYKLPDQFISSLNDRQLNFRVVRVDDISHQVIATAIERFRVAVEMGPEYESICLLDADMFFHNPVDLFFNIASKGFIVTGSNGMIIDFNRSYQDHYDIHLGVETYPYAKIHTTAPIFLSPPDLDWFDTLYESRRVDSWDDFLFLNILGIKLGKSDRMLCMPPYAFTGIHHWQLKVETSILYKGPGLVLTGTEEPIYISHGKFWDDSYCKDLLTVMYGYLTGHDMGEKCRIRVEDAHRTLLGEFRKYLGYVPGAAVALESPQRPEIDLNHLPN